MNDKLNFVSSILDNKIVITALDKQKWEILKLLGAYRKWLFTNKWLLPYNSENDLAKKLQTLRDDNFMFSGGHAGWDPINVFIYLRQKNCVNGEVVRIEWVAPNKTITDKM